MRMATIILSAVVSFLLAIHVPTQLIATPASAQQPAARVTASPASTSSPRLDQFVPSDAVAFIQVKDLKAQVETLRLIDLWKGLWPLLYPKLKQAPEGGAIVEAFWPVVAPSLEGAQLTLALWPDPAQAVSAEQPLNRKLLVGAFIQFASGNNQLVQLLKSPLAKNLSLGGSSNGLPKLDFAMLNDTLVVGDPSVVAGALQGKTSPRSLSDDPGFKAGRARWASMPIFVYVDPALAQQLIEAQRPVSVSASQEKANSFTAVGQMLKRLNIQKLPKVALGIQCQGPQTIVSGLLLEERSFSGSAQAISDLFKLVDVGLRPAQWQSAQTDASITLALDWPMLYDAYALGQQQSVSSSRGSGRLLRPVIERVLDRQLRYQLLPALGSLSVSTDSLQSWLNESHGQVDTLNLTALVSLRNRPLVERTLNLMQIANRSNRRAVSHRGIRINQFGQWHYALLDDFLAVSPQSSSIQSAIEQRRAGRTLADVPEFTRAMQGLPQSVSGWGYVSPSTIRHFTDTLRQQAVKDDARIAGMLSMFATAFQPASLGIWKENRHLALEFRLPEGFLPVVLASNIASNRANVRKQQSQSHAETSSAK
ncbi:MAG: hypothetical protein NZ823_04380 [Blastocatellia bacterium]|nr:hypothetical protein [Blastocatellia bacterium]